MFVAPWECSRAVAQLPRTADPDIVACFIEAVDKGASLPWHRQKLVLILSAMRHFADALIAAGYRVDYRRAASYEDGLLAAAQEHGAHRVVATEGREWEMMQSLTRATQMLGNARIPLELRADRGFLATHEDFARWSKGKKELRMELFYREMRRKHDILMEADGKPTGGAWNFDAENRKPWPKSKAVAPRMTFAPDDITRATMHRVERWSARWASADGFSLPVTRADAKLMLERFITGRLPEFGPYEDAMQHGEADLLHSALASAINVGLLHPKEVVQRAVRETGRVHHIPRLMVQSNFATLLGVTPAALNRWFWAAFTDAYEWVTLPNVVGMATWGDGGVMASKPYVASGAYINRMSNYCGDCRYDVKAKTGDDACPFNVLYWDFLARHRERFANHPRMAMMIRNLDRIPDSDLVQIRRSATAFRDSLEYDGTVPLAALRPE